ncbi:uncharacterized GPI-anchored protein At4g28100 [Amaranthus tricolor]|uniref:uncharacterized GPI-anchored protein At4g28100 n=1 Tax=Amaranthus tricolor TaxID=29722 RepID=UPI00258AAD1B|nr:uncharacterized GPI-anchored protein At4g28100 [Amaranthus tricolor]
MFHHLPPLPLPIIFTLLLSLLPQLPGLPILPNPDPATIQTQQTFHPNPTPPATIPSFPEQSAVVGCPLNLPDGIFPAVKTSCSVDRNGQINKGKCCPVLAAWLYSAYSQTALQAKDSKTASYEMPLLPDDSETCIDDLEKAMENKGVKLVHPNSSCDVVYCYCGIRLHQLSCSQAFHIDENGILSGDYRVKKLEEDCLSAKHNNGSRKQNSHSKLAACSKCLKSLYSLKKGSKVNGNSTKVDVRTSKMRSRDCDLMGLTWLLNKDRDAYISTVTTVMRALMLNDEGSDPRSCSLNSDGMPLAVDSDEINGQSSSVSLRFSLFVYVLSFFLLIMSSSVLS